MLSKTTSAALSVLLHEGIHRFHQALIWRRSMPLDRFIPSEKQERLFQDTILGEKGTILTLKVVGYDNRGFAVNIRGPLDSLHMTFPINLRRSLTL